MSQPDLEAHARAVLDLIAGTDGASPERKVIGIAGPPGSGKSTLAAEVVKRLNQGAESAALLPMDGFHLENDELTARGLLPVKGAPQTFDVKGFLGLMRCLRQTDGDIRYPLFDRERDCTLPDAGCLTADTRIVVVEGNYLLLRDPLWCDLKPLFDATVMLIVPMEELESRLISRWIEHGLDPVSAAKRARSNDLVNAERVLKDSAAADLSLTQ